MIEFLGDLAQWFGENWDGRTGYLNRTWEHIQVSAVSVALAAIVAMPLAAWLAHHRRAEVVAPAVVNIGRALPSFGILALAVPFTIRIANNVPFIDSGIGFFPTAVALFALALPPIFTNTYAGVRGVDPGTVEAARGMGITQGRLLREVEMPLAAAVIITGLRIAAVQVVATATLGAIIGFGGLGRYIVDGLAQRDNVQLVAGAVLVALLAIATEVLFSWAERWLVPEGLRRSRVAADETAVTATA